MQSLCSFNYLLHFEFSRPFQLVVVVLLVWELGNRGHFHFFQTMLWLFVLWFQLYKDFISFRQEILLVLWLRCLLSLRQCLWNIYWACNLWLGPLLILTSVIAEGDLLLWLVALGGAKIALVLFVRENIISLLRLSELFCDAFNCVHKIALVIEFKQLFVAIFGKTCLNQVFQNHLNLMHLRFINDGIDLMSYVTDVHGSGRKTMPPFQIVKQQGSPILGTSKPLFQFFSLE